ncbi:MAG TPA: XdhC family protein [bacterium]|nr:XdhC family protein [bacterium]HQG44071.1 XdhC family protein [bacterium]HQI48742.1 XdhC family protein [bacterium]HQJ65229.1 XdhC family protein [bacterium]
MKIKDYWQFILEKSRLGIPVVLLVVTANSGATPGKPGFKMAAAADGGLAGSIGGGKLEFDLVEEARALLRSANPAPVLRRLRLEEDGSAEANGMICGGEQSVLLYPLQPADRSVIETLIAVLAVGGTGSWSITNSEMLWSEETGPSGTQPGDDAHEGEVLYQERIFPNDTLYLVGGGHVSLALSQLMNLLEWRIVVLDDRPGVDTLKHNRWAEDKIITPYAEAARHIHPGEKSWVVIMTPSHRADEIVLRTLVRLPLRYLGMMASRTKAAEILEHLRREGVAEELLQRVWTPVGLPIASHTPAEIAVSIAAQLIQIRNQSTANRDRRQGGAPDPHRSF